MYLQPLLKLAPCLHAVNNDLERLGGDGVEHGVDHGHVLGGTGGAELKASATVGEGGGAVAVLGRHLDAGPLPFSGA